MAGFIVSCLIAGFVAFPGLVLMYAWNFVTTYVENLPTIGIFQGILLWGITALAYFLFRKEKVVVCMRAPQGLSDEELKKVFSEIKSNSPDDAIIQAMMKAREAEFLIKNKEAETQNKEEENSVNINQ